MSDLISRQSLKQKLQKHHDFFIGAYGGYLPKNDKSRVDEIENCIAMVVNEPSVENKGEWIPVSERLPRIADVYRVTRYYPNNAMNPIYLVDACCFDGFNTWYDDNRINHERAYVDNVIAWQENPEPYKSESEDKK